MTRQDNARWIEGSRDRRIFIALYEEGVRIKAIARAFDIGLPHTHTLANRFGLSRKKPVRTPRPPAPDAGTRKCLKCQKMFPSKGRHNHICVLCNAANERLGSAIA